MTFSKDFLPLQSPPQFGLWEGVINGTFINRNFQIYCSQENVRIKSVLSTTDLNECETLETSGCDANALCTNTEGSYICRCIKGFEGDGRNCRGKWVL